MKKIQTLKVIFTAAIVFLSGCALIPDWMGGPSSNGSYSSGVENLISYGVDNNWMNIDAGELGDCLVNDGECTATSIEFLGWASSNYYENPEKLFDKFDSFLSAMRARKIWVMVSLCNDNKGLGKYGDNNKGLDQYKPQLQKVVSYIKSKGPEGLIIQPVGETRTPTGTWMEQLCQSQLSGFKLCWNHGSRPSGTPGGYYTFAYHPASLSDVGKAGGWTITDHSTALREKESGENVVAKGLNLGGDVFGYANPDALQPYATKVLAAGGRGFGYYGFGHKKIDKPAIKAIGRAVKATR